MGVCSFGEKYVLIVFARKYNFTILMVTCRVVSCFLLHNEAVTATETIIW